MQTNTKDVLRRPHLSTKRTLITLVLTACSSILISGCIPAIDKLLTSDFTVEYPASYDEENPVILTKDNVVEGAKPITITYDENTKTPLNVYFNGQNVSDCYTYPTKTEAIAELYCMREYFRQGTNSISVNPQSLFKGLTHTFLLDTAGPQTNIQKVCFTDNADCTQSRTGNVEVTVNYIDPSVLESTTLNSLDPTFSEGTKRTFLVPVSETYTFSSKDSNGYESTNIYKADGQRITEVANIRVAEDMLGEFLPLINDQASGMESGEPDGSGEPVLKDITVDVIGIRIAADVQYIKVGKMDMKKLAIGDTSPYPLTMDMFMEPLDADWIDQDEIVDADNVGVEVLLNLHDYTQCWDFAGCGWIGLTEAIPCPIKGWDRCNYGITVKNMRMRMYIESIQVKSAIALGVDQGQFDIKLNKLDGKNVINMHDVRASLTGGQLDDSKKGSIIDKIISSPAISGLIKGIVEDTINRNMEELKLEKVFDFDTGAQMELAGRIENMDTDGGADDNIGNLTIDMSAVFKTVVPDKTIPPALGSYYVNDQPSLPKTVDQGSSLGVVVNSNVINQGLLAMYNTGATHLTMLNKEMHTGLGITDDLGNNNDTRVELIPSSPGEFFMTGETTQQAFISFRSAEMIVSKKKKGVWKPLTRINIDIKAGVKMGVEEGFVTMTIAGTPEYHINHMDDIVIGNDKFGISIGSTFIEGLVKTFIEWGIPFIADSQLKIDVSKAGISDKLYTESATSNNGHLNFETSVTKSDEP